MIKALITCQLLLFGITSTLFGQDLPKVMIVTQKDSLNKNIHAEIYGQVKYRNTVELVPFGKIELLDSLKKNLKTFHTQSDGKFHFDSLESGNYNLLFSLDDHMKHMIINIPVSAFDSIFVNFGIAKPWPNYGNEIKICQKCNSVKKVIRIFNGSLPSSSINPEARSLIRQHRKARKRGYGTYILADGEEVLTDLYIESEAQKMKESGKDWFCKRCKIAF